MYLNLKYYYTKKTNNLPPDKQCTIIETFGYDLSPQSSFSYFDPNNNNSWMTITHSTKDTPNHLIEKMMNEQKNESKKSGFRASSRRKMNSHWLWIDADAKGEFGQEIFQALKSILSLLNISNPHCEVGISQGFHLWVEFNEPLTNKACDALKTAIQSHVKDHFGEDLSKKIEIIYGKRTLSFPNSPSYNPLQDLLKGQGYESDDHYFNDVINHKQTPLSLQKVCSRLGIDYSKVKYTSLYQQLKDALETPEEVVPKKTIIRKSTINDTSFDIDNLPPYLKKIIETNSFGEGSRQDIFDSGVARIIFNYTLVYYNLGIGSEEHETIWYEIMSLMHDESNPSKDWEKYHHLYYGSLVRTYDESLNSFLKNSSTLIDITNKGYVLYDNSSLIPDLLKDQIELISKRIDRELPKSFKYKRKEQSTNRRKLIYHLLTYKIGKALYLSEKGQKEVSSVTSRWELRAIQQKYHITGNFTSLSLYLDSWFENHSGIFVMLLGKVHREKHQNFNGIVVKRKNLISNKALKTSLEDHLKESFLSYKRELERTKKILERLLGSVYKTISNSNIFPFIFSLYILYKLLLNNERELSHSPP